MSADSISVTIPPSSDNATRNLPSGLSSVRLRHAVLDVVTGPQRGSELDLGPCSHVIGSDAGCDLVIEDEFVSRLHLRLTPTPDGVHMVDLSSRNGTYIGGCRVVEALIERDTMFSAGRSSFALRMAPDDMELPVSESSEFGSALGKSSAMRAVFALLEQAARSEATVLFEGDSGTGKDILATSLHERSTRREGPFVVVDCGSLPENLIESELFGHERGAFTGATQTRIGALEAANGGTLFLDEVGELPLELQPKLLRALESRSFRRLGSTRTLSVDARFVAATNRRLLEAVRAGQFREDLFYRLAVLRIRVPALAERREDVPLLATRFLRHATRNENAELPPSMVRLLSSYHWPGNARELRNVIERFATFQVADQRLLFGEQAMTSGAGGPTGVQLIPEAYRGMPYHEIKNRVIAELHEQILPATVEACGGSVSEAAKRLGLPRQSLYRMLKNLD